MEASKPKQQTAVDSQKLKSALQSSFGPTGQVKHAKRRVEGYQSEGVKDNDIFELPGSDWQLLGLLTVLAAFVRLFRIYQPSSVVFDEVQYVKIPICVD